MPDGTDEEHPVTGLYDIPPNGHTSHNAGHWNG